MSEDLARALLHEHAERRVTGHLEDPATWAAVACVERTACVAGHTDSVRLAALFAADAPLPAGRLGELVEESIERVVAAIRRRQRDNRIEAGVLNAPAGHYAVTKDAVLLRAAVRAAHRTFEEVPYYTQRYGGRGSRFAGSDSAWLATLTGLPLERALQQVTWLSGLLACKGMPSWLMERHLDDLALGLDEAAGTGTSGVLPGVAAALRERRCAAVPHEVLLAAEHRVDDEVGVRQPVPQSGALVVAEVADQRSGMTTGHDVALDWLVERSAPDVADLLREIAAGTSRR
ncbi:hypothetical protein [Nocardioides acrostichi]|uniref:Uncharacterized protein n=1 Tax=Nocardioides acrostichi TaxID=2784339 RepID=A0A930YE46_9ACTN|nr:hypothetical protein [Nocardioides acrostichi]MBF4163134.1 hypothetical protein [Nocardioides acrostichi]